MTGSPLPIRVGSNRLIGNKAGLLALAHINLTPSRLPPKLLFANYTQTADVNLRCQAVALCKADPHHSGGTAPDLHRTSLLQHALTAGCNTLFYYLVLDSQVIISAERIRSADIITILVTLKTRMTSYFPNDERPDLKVSPSHSSKGAVTDSHRVPSLFSFCSNFNV